MKDCQLNYKQKKISQVVEEKEKGMEAMVPY